MISDTSNVWVLVNVYQKDLPYVRVGDPATIQTDAYPDTFHGRISYVAASLDPKTRTLQARIETNNPGREAEEGHVRDRLRECRNDSRMRLRCLIQQCCETAKISPSCMPRYRQTSSDGGR